jgi:hypothetical protein
MYKNNFYCYIKIRQSIWLLFGMVSRRMAFVAIDIWFRREERSDEDRDWGRPAHDTVHGVCPEGKRLRSV